MTFSPQKGLLVSTTATYPVSARAKVLCATKMLQAGRSAGRHYGAQPLAWVVDLAILLLEQAGEQLGAEWVPPMEEEPS